VEDELEVLSGLAAGALDVLSVDAGFDSFADGSAVPGLDSDGFLSPVSPVEDAPFDA